MLNIRQLMPRSVQIVFRLRFAVACIALTLILAGIIGAYQLSHLVSSQEDAIEHAVPSLVTAHELQSELARILVLKERLRQADSTIALSELDSRISQLIRSLQDTVAQDVTFLTPALTSPFTRIDAGLTNLDQLLSESTPLQLKLITGRVTLTEQRQQLVELRTRFRYLIEPHLIKAILLLDETLDRPASLSIAARDSITAQVNVQKSLSELSFRVMSAIDLAEQMSLQTGSQLSSKGSVELQFRLRSVAQTLASLENDPFRLQLALELRQLHNLILGEEGLIEEIEVSDSHKASLYRLREEQSVIIEDLSQAVDSLVVKARAEISTSSVIFNDVLYQTLALMLAAALLIILIGVWVSYQVVERQIGRRMSRLTSAVLDIADGDTKRIVAVSGDDELGQMASALEVFKENARKLHETSEEMEQFAYAAAHDLRSPLRAIETLTQWTIEDGDDLPKDCLDNLQKILQRTRRLSTLQSDLLEYSRAGHTQESLEVVSLADMVGELSDLLDPEGHYSIRMVDQLPIVSTYATPLRQVLMNLLTNAIKHHDNEHGSIEVRGHASGDRISLSVQDDGAGIEPQFQERIFDLFKTLQSQDTVEGSGLGLALILKLVTRYGGQVTVSSCPETARGTTFSFDWPAQSVSPLKLVNSTRSGVQPGSMPLSPFDGISGENPGSSPDSPNDENKEFPRKKAS